MKKVNWKHLAVILLVGTLAVIGLEIYRRAHTPPPGQWLRDSSDSLNEILKSNDAVKIGEHTWRGRRDGETNGPAVKQPNTLKQEMQTK